MEETTRIDERNAREIAQMNTCVLERLRADDTVQVLIDEDLQLFGVAEFFSPDECEKLIAMIDAVARPSPVFNIDAGRAARTSYSGDLDAYDPFVKMLHRRMDDLMGIEEDFGETMQGQRYQVGQQFKPHHDWFDTTQEYWTPLVARAGQRAWTVMVYLNDVEGGGATEFPEMEVAIPPQQGTLIAWNNANPDGTPNMATLHAGTPVTEGVKYIVTRWYRGRKWFYPPKPGEVDEGTSN